jgi:hypothetical protein
VAFHDVCDVVRNLNASSCAVSASSVLTPPSGGTYSFRHGLCAPLQSAAPAPFSNDSAAPSIFDATRVLDARLCSLSRNTCGLRTLGRRTPQTEAEHRLDIACQSQNSSLRRETFVSLGSAIQQESRDQIGPLTIGDPAQLFLQVSKVVAESTVIDDVPPEVPRMRRVVCEVAGYVANGWQAA